jgi:hypothetical protein
VVGWISRLCQNFGFVTLACVGKILTHEGSSIMTFTSRFAPGKLLVGGVAALALSLVVSASVSARSDSSGNKISDPVTISQCTNPGYKHFGFASMQDCEKYVSDLRPGSGQGEDGQGYGGSGVNNNQSIFVQIGNVVNSTVNVTINFITNIFS